MITSTGHAAVDLAPAAARRLDVGRARDQLWIVAARIVDFEPHATEIDVHLAHRRAGQGETVRAQAVFERRVRVPDVTQSENPVLVDLLLSGAARQAHWAWSRDAW